MCTTIAGKMPIGGSGKAQGGWFELDHAYVGYDHPVHAQQEHALTLDFVNEGLGPAARVAVELPREQARALANRILATLEEADVYEEAGRP